MLLDQTRNGRAESFLLVGTDPNKEPAQQEVGVCVPKIGHDLPVWILNAGGQGRSNARAGTDPNATTEHGRSVPYGGCVIMSKESFGPSALRRTYQTLARVSRGFSAGSALGFS